MAGIYTASLSLSIKLLTSVPLEVKTDVRNLFQADSAFYVENVQQYVTHASNNKIVITLSQANIKQLRKAYKVWKLRADVRGEVKCDGDKLSITLREINGVPVTMQTYQLTVNETERSLLCSEWKEVHAREVSGILPQGLALNDNRTATFEVALDNRSSILDIGKQKTIAVEKVLIQGTDYLGRTLSLQLTAK